MAINKVIYDGSTLIDLTGDTLTAEDLVTGILAHDKSGAPITGNNPYAKAATDATVNTQTALIEQIMSALEGKAGGGGTGEKIATGSLTPGVATSYRSVSHDLGKLPTIVVVFAESIWSNAAKALFCGVAIGENKQSTCYYDASWGKVIMDNTNTTNMYESGGTRNSISSVTETAIGLGDTVGGITMHSGVTYRWFAM